jgi:hypothetical protein
MRPSIEVTTPSDREVTVTRIFNAPAQLQSGMTDGMAATTNSKRS